MSFVSFARTLAPRMMPLLCLSAVLLPAQKRFGSTDPAGNPSNFTLFRDQQLFTMSPGTTSMPWQTAVVGFDRKLTPSASVAQLPWSGSLKFSQVAIKAVAGRILSPDKDDIVIVQRREPDLGELVLRFRDGSLETMLSQAFTGRQPGWSDFFSVSEGDVDRLYDAKANYHDEVVAAWMEQEPGGCGDLAVPRIAVVNYNDPAHPAVLSQRIDRADNQYSTYCILNSYDHEIGRGQPPPASVPQANDNIIATAIGDFDGDGYNEIAVAYLRGQAGTAISIVIYRYQNDGTNASLTPVNIFEIYNPSVSIVGTLSLAAGDFDGSGVDQLLVGSAYWSGTSDGDGKYKNGTLVTQPVVFLLKGGQAPATITGAASSGANNTSTDFSVSLGNLPYLPRVVTISGATGQWAGINGTSQVTLTKDGFSLPIDSSQFGPLDGQTVQVTAAAPLTQAATGTFPAVLSKPGPIHIADADKDGRIRVQLVPGLFHFDPANGYGYRRRQVALAWNSRPSVNDDPDTHLVILQVANSDQITAAFERDDVFEGAQFQTYQNLSMAAGAFRGDNASKDPTWSLFFTGFGNGINTSAPHGLASPSGVIHAVWSIAPDTAHAGALQGIKVCVGKASGDSGSPTYYGFVPPICQIWGENATVDSPSGAYNSPNPSPPNNYLRLPAIAADLNGKSLKLGAPAHYQITKPVKAQFILEQPPQHAAFLDVGKGPEVVTVNRYPTFNTSMLDSDKRSFNTNNTDHTDWTVGASEQISASYEQSFGVATDDINVSAKTKFGLSEKVGYDYNNVSSSYHSTADSYTVTQQNATGTDDVLIYNSEILDIWRYRIFGSGTADTGDPKKPYLYYDIVLPASPSVRSYPGGRDVDWYQPVHEPGNVLSYPDRTSVCNPSDLGSITVKGTDVFNKTVALISCSQQFYNGNSSSIGLTFDHTTSSGSSTDYTHKVHADLDVNATYTNTDRVFGTGIEVTGSLDVDVHGGKDWGSLTTSDDSTSSSTGITVNSPAGDGNRGYPYWPIFYDTDAGALKVAFAVGDLRESEAGKAFWINYYGQQPDPALNLPNRFNAKYSENGILNGWEADNTINRKRMKGFAIRSSTQNPLTRDYPLLGRNPRDGDVVLLETRVYNYSISSHATSSITTQLSVIPMDDKNNEICRSAVGSEPPPKHGGHVCPVGDRTIIGVASSAPGGGTTGLLLPARENKMTYLLWNTKGFGPKVGTALYRVYVDLISDPTKEIYPPEAPCTALPCENGVGIESNVDPGQNNEGWSVVSVEAPAAGYEGLRSTAPVPNALQLSLGSDTPLLRGPQGSFLTADLRRPLPLSLTAFSAVATPLHSYVSIYDGKPGERGTKMIAAKIVQGLRPDGATVWHNWTPLSLVPHHLYATVQNSDGTKQLGDLVVDVQRSIGDVNGDGRVDAHDLNILARDLGKSDADSACGAACDIDGDGKITQTDRILMSNLCDSQGCAFATAEYVGGGSSPLEPDMRTQRAADSAARAAWFAAHPQTTQLLASGPPYSNGLAAYRQELELKTGLHSVHYYYKGKAVTSGPLAPWPAVPAAEAVIYADSATRHGEEVDVPLVIVNSGTVSIGALELKRFIAQTVAGSGQARVISADLALPPGGAFVPGASNTVSVRLRVPLTVKKLELTEHGYLQAKGQSDYQFSGGQIVVP